MVEADPNDGGARLSDGKRLYLVRSYLQDNLGPEFLPNAFRQFEAIPPTALLPELREDKNKDWLVSMVMGDGREARCFLYQCDYSNFIGAEYQTTSCFTEL